MTWEIGARRRYANRNSYQAQMGLPMAALAKTHFLNTRYSQTTSYRGKKRSATPGRFCITIPTKRTTINPRYNLKFGRVVGYTPTLFDEVSED